MYIICKVFFFFLNNVTLCDIRGQFAEFADSPYYSESEVCGGAMAVSFCDALLTMLRRPLITSKFFASELPFHGWNSPEIAWGEIWTVWECSNAVPPIHFFQAEHRI